MPLHNRDMKPPSVPKGGQCALGPQTVLSSTTPSLLPLVTALPPHYQLKTPRKDTVTRTCAGTDLACPGWKRALGQSGMEEGEKVEDLQRETFSHGRWHSCLSLRA